MPYYVYVQDLSGAWIQRGPYIRQSKAEAKKDKMEEDTGKEAELRQWSTWDTSRAKKKFKEELIDKVGVDKGMRRFSSGRNISKEADIRPKPIRRFEGRR